MKRTGRVVSAILTAVIVLSLVFVVGCGGDDQKSGVAELKECGTIHEPEFGGIYIKCTIDDFNSLGFFYGDSVTVAFSNGYVLSDLPYYNGYYTKTGEPLLIAYPGYDYIKAAINNGDDLWNVARLDDAVTATVTLNESGKYLDIQEARDIHYFDDRSLYASDEVFANFRALKGGELKENLLFRSASPCDNQHKRAQYVDKLIKKAGVKHVIDLADTDVKIQGYMAKDDFSSEYFATLYNAADADNDKVEALALNMNFSSDYFKGQTVKALEAIANNEGPYLIHCTEGKDRTGFLCMLIEALAGATYSEIVEDYMMTYFNYYAITKAFDQKRYDTIVKNVLDPMIETIVSGENVDIKTADLSAQAKRFLTDNGMTDTNITALIAKICDN